MESVTAFWNRNDGILGATLVALLIFAVFWLLALLLYRRIIPGVLKKTTEKAHPFFVTLLEGFKRPINVYLLFAGLCFALMAFATRMQGEVLPRSLAMLVTELPAFLDKTVRIGTVVFFTWGLVSSSEITALLLRNARHKLDLHTSKSVTRFLSAVFNVVVIAIAAVVILSELSYDINGLIAGLGLGGLTIALAAKDSAANFFGGLVLVLEKPFEIGDWISCSNVEGTVEDINLRSTKLRTSSGSLTVVPNSVLAAEPITNWSGPMEKRRADFKLNLLYCTPKENLERFTAAVRAILEKEEDVLNDGILVHFSDFKESSLDVSVVFYTALPGFGDHMKIKERVNYALLDAAKECGIEFAYPSRTVYLEDTKKQR